MLTSVARGRLAETMAACYLELHGFVILERNYRFGPLEIDLVARKGKLLTVVEVKFRERSRMGGPAAAVNARKQRDLETAAVAFLKHRKLTGVTVRFDVITADGQENGLVLKHHPGAFSATGRYRG